MMILSALGPAMTRERAPTGRMFAYVRVRPEGEYLRKMF